MISAFVDSVNPSYDIRFQLSWNFGGFLVDVPRRLGTSAALDAAADALAASHARFCVGSSPDQSLLAKHSRALRALRYDLNDCIKARSTETLCAIMILMIVQVCMS